MLVMDAIEFAQIERASLIIFFHREDGTPLICVNYFKLNALTIRDSYPIPRLEECVDVLRDVTIF